MAFGASSGFSGFSLALDLGVVLGSELRKFFCAVANLLALSRMASSSGRMLSGSPMLSSPFRLETVPLPPLQDGFDVADRTSVVFCCFRDGRERPVLAKIIEEGRQLPELDLSRHGMDVVREGLYHFRKILVSLARARARSSSSYIIFVLCTLWDVYQIDTSASISLILVWYHIDTSLIRLYRTDTSLWYRIDTS